MPTPQIRHAYELLGRIVAEWSDVESLWELIFTVALHEAPRSKIDIILQQFRTAAVQQQMIMAVANVAFLEGSYERQEINQLYVDTNDFGDSEMHWFMPGTSLILSIAE